jgi:sugar phosphate isomerase/epimerase
MGRPGGIRSGIKQEVIMTQNSKRREFLNTLATLPLLTAGTISGALAGRTQEAPQVSSSSALLKLALNAYSFNQQLLSGSMSINDMLEFCAANGFLAADITAYYFPGYPKVPSDEYLYSIKRAAFQFGIEISGTGVRNDFTHSDAGKRRESVQLVKDWIVAAEKLGAQTIRIFSGTQNPAGYTRQQVLEWMLKDIRECVAFGKAHGVVVAIQNHDDFIKTAGDTIEIMEAIKSEWFGLMLDIGSFRTNDPYEEIAKTVKYAVTWQIKENVYSRGKEVKVDADKLVDIINASGYRGYLPLETLGQGDPKVKIPALLHEFRKSFSKT